MLRSRVFAVLCVIAAVAGASRESRGVSGSPYGNGPLPQISNIPPFVWIVLSASSSMKTCDGLAAPPGGVNDCFNGFARRTRFKMAMDAIKTFLDVNGDGSVNALDDAAANTKYGLVIYDAAASGAWGTTARVHEVHYPGELTLEQLWCGQRASGEIDCGGKFADTASFGLEDITTAYADPVNGGPWGPGAPLNQILYVMNNGTKCAGCPAGFAGTLNCGDGNAATPCYVAPTPGANDKFWGCRHRDVVLFTDGAWNTSNADPTPPDAYNAIWFSGYLYYLAVVHTADPATAFPVWNNCLGHLGGFDANGDGDGLPWTPCNVGGGAGACPGSAGNLGCAFAVNNPYTAANVHLLKNFFVSLANQTNAGYFSRARPVVTNHSNAATLMTPAVNVRAPRAVFAPYFEVVPGKIQWQGHLAKFTYGQKTNADNEFEAQFFKCDGTALGGAALTSGGVMCYDAGAKLNTRLWSSRRLLTVLPKTGDHLCQNADRNAGNQQPFFNLDTWGSINGAGKDGQGSNNGNDTFHNVDPGGDIPVGAGSKQSGWGWLHETSYLVDFTDLATYTDLSPTFGDQTHAATATDIDSVRAKLLNGTGCGDIDLSALDVRGQRFMMLANLIMRKDHALTYDDDLGNCQNACAWRTDYNARNPGRDFLSDALNLMQLAAGKPTARFADGSCRLGNAATCNAGNDAMAAWKLADIYESQPVAVQAPKLAVDDVDYFTFQECYDYGLTVSHESGNACPAPTSTYVAAGNGADIRYRFATGCAMTGAAVYKCKVKNRMPMVYAASNDGWIHAFYDGAATIANYETNPNDVNKYKITLTPGDEMWAFMPFHSLHKIRNFAVTHTHFTEGDLAVRDIKFDPDRDSDGRWHSVLMGHHKQGGKSVFALDVTDPRIPVFLWEYRNPKFMGTWAGRMDVTRQNPDNINTRLHYRQRINVPGGLPDPTSLDLTPDARLFSFAPGDTELHYKEKDIPNHDDSGTGLKDDETIPAAQKWGLTGGIRIADLDRNGYTRRGYFGDNEGRVWKACAPSEGDGWQIHNFFDPGFHHHNPPVPYGTDYDKGDPATPASTKAYRGPIFYPPTVARAEGDNWQVVVGTGDLTDGFQVVDTNVGYKNYVWTLVDQAGHPPRWDIGGDFDIAGSVGQDYCKSPGAGDPTDNKPGVGTCCASQGVWCATPTQQPSIDPGLESLPLNSPYLSPPGRIRVWDRLAGPPVVFNSTLLYTEFQMEGGDACSWDSQSRLKAWDMSSGGCQPLCTLNATSPTAGIAQGCGKAVFNGQSVFNFGQDTTTTDPLSGAVSFNQGQGIVSGPVIDDASGTVFVMSSRIMDQGNPIISIGTNLGNMSNASSGSAMSEWRMRDTLDPFPTPTP